MKAWVNGGCVMLQSLCKSVTVTVLDGGLFTVAELAVCFSASSRQAHEVVGG